MAKNDWNKEGFFSGITDDYSNYHWYKGEKENPYNKDTKRPYAARFWEYEKEFHMNFLDACDTKANLKQEYKAWKKRLLEDHLPGESPNPYGDTTDWNKVFETGIKD
ncbi:MAG: hypothetical protein WCS56_05160 [Bacilli bacterium]|jgi:predicted GIY-YIG superfamily endonuclease